MPTTHYTTSDGLSIAYQVVGEGPGDLVYVPGFTSNIDVMWEDPVMARFLNRLASFSRLILFDKRGTGLSDRVPLDQLPTIEERMHDVAAVMEAVDSSKATIMGHSEGGNMSILFAATHPERTTSLILIASYARRIPSEDYPWAPTVDDRAAEIERTRLDWGQPDKIPKWLAPGRYDDPNFREWFAKYMRSGASPAAAAHLMTMNTLIDTTSLLPSIAVPTLCLYRRDDTDVKAEEGRWIAEQIPQARYVELPGDAHFLAEPIDDLLDEIEEFVTGEVVGSVHERKLTTVLFTDIVASTQRMSSMGDEAWTTLLATHHEVVRAELDKWDGVEVDTAGDGFFATFDGPARAVKAAQAIVAGVKRLGIDVRAGVHTGEVELADGKVAGMAVNIGARISSLAAPGEVLVSRTVRDLVAGSGLEFTDRGSHHLKGVSDEWQLYQAV